MKINRHDSYKVGKNAIERILKSGINDYRTIKVTLPAVASLPTSQATTGVFKDSLGPDPTVDVIASGTPLFINDIVVWTVNDGYVGDSVEGVVTAPPDHGIVVEIDPADAANVATGKKAYIIPAATATTGGLVTTDDDTGTNTLIGYFIDPASANVAVTTAGRGTLPVGTFAKIALTQF